MKFIFETDRLYLRQFSLGDATAIYNLNSDPEVIRYTGDPPFESTDEALHFLENYNDYQKYQMGRWAVILKASDEFIGWSGLKNHPGQYVDLGFRFYKREWGKGYATEALKTVFDFLFNNLNKHRIIGSVDPDNKRSISLMERLGFRKEGHFKESLLFKGKWVDDVIYAMLKKEWLE